MLLIPAIDLRNGHCVQLRQGAPETAAVYSNDPSAMARRWTRAGARRLHVVDLDGAFAGRPTNQRLVADIVAAAGSVPVQVGGGVRSLDAAAAYFDVGASNVIVGTRAIEEPEFLTTLCARWPGRVILGLDGRDGKAATRGWTAGATVDAFHFIAKLGDIDLFAIVHTDISRDGMLTGVNIAATARLAALAPAPVIASGGVTNLEDLRALKALALGADRLLGAISGSALYEGTLDFAAGQRLLDAAVS